MKTKTMILIVVALALVWLVYNFLTKDKEDEKKTPVVAVNPPPKVASPNTSLPRPNIVPTVGAVASSVLKTPSPQASKGWDFWDNDFFKGDVGFKGKTPHSFKVGQAIYVSQKVPHTNASYNGVARVIAVPDSMTVVINKPFGKSTPPESGVINLA